MKEIKSGVEREIHAPREKSAKSISHIHADGLGSADVLARRLLRLAEGIKN